LIEIQETSRVRVQAARVEFPAFVKMILGHYFLVFGKK